VGKCIARATPTKRRNFYLLKIPVVYVVRPLPSGKKKLPPAQAAPLPTLPTPPFRNRREDRVTEGEGTTQATLTKCTPIPLLHLLPLQY
jgi:hypothetical protein